MPDSDLVERIERNEEELRLLLPPDVVSLARADERIRAAIRLSEVTGMALDDAQRVVNRL
jgi:hypothetical protein